jgi:hypothetical protein
MVGSDVELYEIYVDAIEYSARNLANRRVRVARLGFNWDGSPLFHVHFADDSAGPWSL